MKSNKWTVQGVAQVVFFRNSVICYIVWGMGNEKWGYILGWHEVMSCELAP